MATSITGAERVTIFEFPKTCICCNCFQQPKDEDPVYVNKRLQLEKFKVSEQPEQSHRKSRARVREAIRRELIYKTNDVDHVIGRIESLSRYDFEVEDLTQSPVTYGKIKRVNRAFQVAMAELQLPSIPEEV